MRETWQARVRIRLVRGEWIKFAELFESVENDIPLHTAYRIPGNRRGGIVGGRLRVFKLFLYGLGVVTDPPDTGRNRFHYTRTRLRLPHAPHTFCAACASPVLMIKRNLYCPRCRIFIARPKMTAAMKLAAENRAFFAKLRERSAADEISI